MQNCFSGPQPKPQLPPTVRRMARPPLSVRCAVRRPGSGEMPGAAWPTAGTAVLRSPESKRHPAAYSHAPSLTGSSVRFSGGSSAPPGRRAKKQEERTLFLLFRFLILMSRTALPNAARQTAPSQTVHSSPAFLGSDPLPYYWPGADCSRRKAAPPWSSANG